MSSIKKPLTYLNQRSSKQPNYQCGGCSCRTRSHFITCDNGDVYNVDTAGFIWYLANNSTQWAKIYKCRNYIPWQPYISRLDTVARDDDGQPAVYYSDGSSTIRANKRVPVGRPCSGNFCGFQTDTNSCVLFKNGQKVYEGKYFSDIIGSVGYGNVSGLDTFSYEPLFSNNYITEDNCNNNDPPGNSDDLVRNTNGTYDYNWNFNDAPNLIYGDKTSSAKVIITSTDANTQAVERYGWEISVSSQIDCPVDFQTGFHLGTNELGTTVWFTRDPIGHFKYKYAGTSDHLPEIWEINDWVVTDEFGNACNRKLQDNDVIEIDGNCHCLLDYKWVDLNTDWNSLFIDNGTAVIFSDDCSTISNCDDTPDCTIINAKSIQCCGDILLANANSNYPRVILSKDRILLTAPASLTYGDSIACNLSLNYYDTKPIDPNDSLCSDNDGVALVTINTSEGFTQYLAYGHPNDWSIIDQWTEPEPFFGIDSNRSHNCRSFALRQDVTDGYNIRLYRDRTRKADYFFNPNWYTNGKILNTPTGIIGTCDLSYQCPDENGNTLYSLWSDDVTIECGDITWLDTYKQVYYFNTRDATGKIIPSTVTKTETRTYDSYTPNYNTCTSTRLGTNTVNCILTYLPCYHINGRPLYTQITYTATQTSYSGNKSTLIPQQQFLTGTSDLGCYVPTTCSCTSPSDCNQYNNKPYLYLSGQWNPADTVYSPIKPVLDRELPWIVDSSGEQYCAYTGCNTLSITNKLFCVKGIYARQWYTEDEITLTATTYPQSTHTGCSNGACTITLDPLNLVVPNVGVGTCGRLLSSASNAYDSTSIKAAIFMDFQRTGLTGSVCEPIGGTEHTEVIDLENVFQMYAKTISVGATIVRQYSILCVEYCTYPKPDGQLPACPPDVRCISKLVTHLITTESESIGGNFPTIGCDVIKYDYIKDVVEVEDACSSVNSVGNISCGDSYEAYTKTLHYKGCNTTKGFYPICGYVLEYLGTPVNTGQWKISFDGTDIYTSPTPANGTASISHCCLSAFAIVVTETIGTTIKQFFYVEGNLIWQASYDTSLTNHDTIQQIYCCTGSTMIDQNTYANRYAFIRINALQEDLVGYTGEWFQGSNGKSMNCDDYPQGDTSILTDAMEAANDYTITLTDGTVAHPTHCSAAWMITTLNGITSCLPGCWYDQWATTDGIVTMPDGSPFQGLYQKGYNPGDLDGGAQFYSIPIPDAINMAKKTVYETGNGRKSIITHNGQTIGSNKNYEGIYCCGDFMFAAFVDDEYKSGWENYETEGWWYKSTEQKHNPFPNFGDSLPPTLEDQESFKEFIAVWSDYKVDVFYEGQAMGTFACNDFQAPVHYDHLFTADFWVTMAIRSGQMNIGYSPQALEAGPVCIPPSPLNSNQVVVIPYQNTLTALTPNETTTKNFNDGCM